MKNVFFFLLVVAIMLPNQLFSQTIPYSNGRIVISSDGNEHDKDDWAATPFSLALLASQGLQDKVTVYTFSDHVWGSNQDHSDALQQMRESALEGQNQFGFTSTNFIEAVSYKNQAYNAIRDEILASTSADPLTIIAAGPMQVVGEGINRAFNHANYTNQLNHVRIISHSNWNDRHSDNPSTGESHSGWTWAEIESTFSSAGLNCDHIVDQNGGTGYDGMRANKSKFSWLLTSPYRNHEAYSAGSWDWLYSRQEAAQKQQDFDPSDAGMIIYLLTGIEETDPSDAKNLMENPAGGSGDDIRNITDLSASATNCTTIELNWTDNSTGEDGFRVRRKLPGGTYSILADVPAGTESYTDATATESTTYIYMVRPMNNGSAAAISNTPEVSTPACGSGVDIHIEAEDFTNQFGIETEATSDIGGGLNIGWINHNDWAEYSVNIPQAGTYSMTFRVAGRKSATIAVESNNNSVGSVNVSATGDWQTWTTVGPISVDLPAGNQTIKLSFLNAAITNPLINVNWMEIYTPGLKSSEELNNTPSLNDVSIYPNPSTGVLNININSEESAALKIINISGATVYNSFIDSKVNAIDVSDLEPGIYMVEINTTTNTTLQKVIIK
ncbi:MAG: carbohydrate-binding protein [Bacteroidales bacterium]|nr:carbohydrate-binding protein [Bacteroidales bacterium]